MTKKGKIHVVVAAMIEFGESDYFVSRYTFNKLEEARHFIHSVYGKCKTSFHMSTECDNCYYFVREFEEINKEVKILIQK